MGAADETPADLGPPKSKTEELEEELDFLKAIVRSQSQRIDALEKQLA